MPTFSIFAAAFLLASSVLCAPASADDDKMLGPDEFPTTLDAVVKDILANMNDDDKNRLRNTRKDSLIDYHMGFGTYIRNHYGLWRGNTKLLVSACGKPCHPDDASMIIIEAVWAETQR